MELVYVKFSNEMLERIRTEVISGLISSTLTTIASLEAEMSVLIASMLERTSGEGLALLISARTASWVLIAARTSPLETAVLMSDKVLVCEPRLVEISLTEAWSPAMSTFSAAGAGAAAAVLISAKTAPWAEIAVRTSALEDAALISARVDFCDSISLAILLTEASSWVRSVTAAGVEVAALISRSVPFCPARLELIVLREVSSPVRSVFSAAGGDAEVKDLISVSVPVWDSRVVLMASNEDSTDVRSVSGTRGAGVVAAVLISARVLFWDSMLVPILFREVSIEERSTFSATGAGAVTADLISPKAVVCRLNPSLMIASSEVTGSKAAAETAFALIDARSLVIESSFVVWDDKMDVSGEATFTWRS